MTLNNKTSVSIVFRYWKKGRLLQLQAEVATVALAIRTVHNTAKKCEEEKLDWLGEIFPFASDPIVYGSRKGLEHRNELF